MNEYRDWTSARAAPGPFPPEVLVQIKALACEPQAASDLPLSRFGCIEIAHEAQRSGIVASITSTTVWRWLHADAIRPWRHRSWIFPHDPDFAAKADAFLTLYARRWEGRRLRGDEFVISADEKTSIQARVRMHSTSPARPGHCAGVEHEYRRCGAWAYIAPRCTPSQDIRPLRKGHGHRTLRSLVAQVMTQPPYRDARRSSGSLTTSLRIVVRQSSALDPSISRSGVPVHGPDPRELAQPDRNLLLHCSAQSPDSERLPAVGGYERAAAARLRQPPLRLGASRETISSEGSNCKPGFGMPLEIIRCRIYEPAY